jgi:hypothetical protein
MTEPDYEAERKLPDGKTCADCRHGPTCGALFGAVRQRFTYCDFWPSQYLALATDAARTALNAGQAPREE